VKRGGPEDEDAADGSSARDTTQGFARGREYPAVARELSISRNTVSKYLEQPAPGRRTRRRRARPVWERVRTRLEELLAEWEPRTTPKQRLTGVRVLRALREEGYQVGRTVIYEYLRERRRQRAEVYVPLVHRPAMKRRSTSSK